jgi:hypothetical protein
MYKMNVTDFSVPVEQVSPLLATSMDVDSRNRDHWAILSGYRALYATGIWDPYSKRKRRGAPKQTRNAAYYSNVVMIDSGVLETTKAFGYDAVFEAFSPDESLAIWKVDYDGSNAAGIYFGCVASESGVQVEAVGADVTAVTPFEYIIFNAIAGYIEIEVIPTGGVRPYSCMATAVDLPDSLALIPDSSCVAEIGASKYTIGGVLDDPLTPASAVLSYTDASVVKKRMGSLSVMISFSAFVTPSE